VEWEVAAITREDDYHVKEYVIYTYYEHECTNDETEQLLSLSFSTLHSGQ